VSQSRQSRRCRLGERESRRPRRAVWAKTIKSVTCRLGLNSQDSDVPFRSEPVTTATMVTTCRVGRCAVRDNRWPRRAVWAIQSDSHDVPFGHEKSHNGRSDAILAADQDATTCRLGRNRATCEVGGPDRCSGPQVRILSDIHLAWVFVILKSAWPDRHSGLAATVAIRTWPLECLSYFEDGMT
jgi:hypothetical protein